MYPLVRSAVRRTAFGGGGEGAWPAGGAPDDRPRRRALVAHEKSRLGPRDEPEVLDQHPVEARLLRLVLAAQHGGWMERGDRLLRPARGKETATVPEHAEIGGDDRARRRRAEADEHLGLDRRDLGLHPGAAGRELAQPRRLVDAALAALDELEVLDRVRDVEPLPVQAHLDQRAVEHLARRANERRALQILLIAGLLADEDDAGIGGAPPRKPPGPRAAKGDAPATAPPPPPP